MRQSVVLKVVGKIELALEYNKVFRIRLAYILVLPYAFFYADIGAE